MIELSEWQPMLATSTKNPVAALAGLDQRWSLELKFDGMRCLTSVTDGQVQLRSRSGTSMTARYPEVAAQLAEVGEVVLDGEMVCFDASGRPSFGLAQQRQAQVRPAAIARVAAAHPASFVAFDLLWQDGTDLRGQPLAMRQALLAELAEGWQGRSRLHLSQTFGVTAKRGERLWQFVQDQRLEGLVAKRLDSRYRGTRDGAWLKLKNLARASLLVTGFDPGEGSRAGKVGALHLAALDSAGREVQVGKVGSGLSERHHGPMLAALNAGEQFVVDVEYLSYACALRMPVLIGLSTTSRSSCALTQLENP